MFEVYIAAILVFLGLFMVFNRLLVLESKSDSLEQCLNTLSFDPLVASEGIMAQIEALIQDYLGSMHVPTAMDHVAAAVSQLIQAKAMKSMGIDPMMLQNQHEEFDHEANVD